MKALRRQDRQARAAQIEEVPVPDITPGHVLLKVHYCGVCGSDLHAFLNHPGYEATPRKFTFGHELSATVVECADDVTYWKPGQRATMIAAQGCLKTDCEFCSVGDIQLCPERRIQGLHYDGGMAEYVLVDQRFLLSLPGDIDLRSASLTEPLSVADHCVVNRSPVTAGHRVVVTGPGIIGMLCALVAREQGADVLMIGATADEDVRLPVARKIGLATHIVGPNEASLGNQVREHFGTEADVMFEASGAPPALASAADAVKINGTITVVALYGSDVQFNATQLVRKQIDLRTSYGSTVSSYKRAMTLLASGRIPVDALVREYPLTDAISAFRDAEKQAVMKPLLAC